MITRWLCLVLAGLMLAACERENSNIATSADASPLLYEVTNKQGEVEAWLFGTIHALPDGVQWRTQPLQEAIKQSDFLIVEIAELENATETARIYAQLATNDVTGPLKARVNQDRRAELINLMRRSNFDQADFDRVETWAAALMLAQLAKTGENENGVDRVIIRDFSGRRVEEFEGARKQLMIFDELPEQDQRDLLDGVMDDIARSGAAPSELRDAWLSGDEDKLIEATQSGIMADPELREALLVRRNQDWIEQLAPILKQDREPMIAVGAGHLVGPDGLPAMLKARGFNVERLE